MNNINSNNYINEEYNDKYWIFKGFFTWVFKRDIDVIEMHIYNLYNEKRYIWLNEFFVEGITQEEYQKIKDNDEKKLDFTLDYLIPLIKDWKLKARIISYIKKTETYFDFWSEKFYDKNNVDEFIRDLKEKYFSIDNERDLRFFKEICVEFTIPENDWLDWEYV